MKHLSLIAILITSATCPADESRTAEVPDDAVAFAINASGDESFGVAAAWSRHDELFVAVTPTADREVRIPRLASVVLSVSEPALPDRKWSVHPEPGFWILKPATASGETPALLHLKLDAPAALFDPQHVTNADERSVVFLPAKLAVTHGELLRFEPQPHKNTVGYWANEKDTVEWMYQLDKPGTFDIDILQGCGKGHGGSRVALKSDGGEIAFEVTETGHFQNFIWRTLGTVELPATERSVIRLEPIHKAAGAVMDVRTIRLVPHGAQRSFESELAEPDSLPKELAAPVENRN